MMATALATYCDNLALVDFRPTTTGGNTFIDTVPATPDTLIVFTDYPGPEPDIPHGYDYPNVQVRVRSLDSEAAKSKLASIYSGLHNLHEVKLPCDIWLGLCRSRQSGPAYLGRDQNQRHEYVQNYECHIRNVTTHRE